MRSNVLIFCLIALMGCRTAQFAGKGSNKGNEVTPPAQCPDDNNPKCKDVKCPDAKNPLCKPVPPNTCPDETKPECKDVTCPDKNNPICKPVDPICPDPSKPECDKEQCPDDNNPKCKPACPDPKNPACGPVPPECPDPKNPKCETPPDCVNQSGDKCNPPKPTCPDEKNPKCHIFTICKDTPERKLIASLYKVDENIEKLPDFGQLKRIDQFCMRQLDIPDHDYKEGFPGVKDLDEWFGLDINWQVYIPKSGAYQFKMNSDDGSILFINDKVVINNDGTHPQKAVNGKVTITKKGWHRFRVKYYQGPRYRIALELFWQPPGKSKMSPIPEGLFARP